MSFFKKTLSTKPYVEQIKKHKGTFAVYVILRAIVVGAMVTSFIRGNYENVFYSALALILFIAPAFFEKNFGLKLPNILEIVIMLFIFASIVLGEMYNYYLKIPVWDTMLHTINGFLCAAVGFGMVDILNRNEKIKFQLSPVFLAVVAFCFSMTIGVLWEFFEFSCDMFLGADTQKDTVIHTINSAMLNSISEGSGTMANIVSTTVNGQVLPIDGYLDVGLYDTMKDLIVNFVGAAVFCVIGFIYVKSRGKNRIAAQFIPRIAAENKEEKKDEQTDEI